MPDKTRRDANTSPIECQALARNAMLLEIIDKKYFKAIKNISAAIVIAIVCPLRSSILAFMLVLSPSRCYEVEKYGSHQRSPYLKRVYQ